MQAVDTIAYIPPPCLQARSSSIYHRSMVDALLPRSRPLSILSLLDRAFVAAAVLHDFMGDQVLIFAVRFAEEYGKGLLGTSVSPFRLVFGTFGPMDPINAVAIARSVDRNSI